MATNSSARVAFRVAGQLRRIFSLGIGKTGSVFISFKSDGTYRDAGHPLSAVDEVSSDHGRKVREQRYTVHPSLNSAENINYIHHHLILFDAPEIETTHLTKAIKSQPPLFALLFARRCATLTTETHKQDTKGLNRTVCLDEFDSKHNTLFYNIAVSSVDAYFPDFLPDFNVWQYNLGNFKFVILWSYLNCGAPPMSLNSHFLTPNNGQVDEETLRNLQQGKSIPEVVELSKIVREHQKGELVSLISRESKYDPQVLDFLQSRSFSKLS